MTPTPPSVTLFLTFLLTHQHVSSSASASDSDVAHYLLNNVADYGLRHSNFVSDIVEKDLYSKGLVLKKKSPAHFVAVYNGQKERSRHMAEYANAALQASRILSQQFRLNRRQVAYELEQVEVRSTPLFERCPTRTPSGTSSLDCASSMLYRSADGRCNNLQEVEWGSSFTPFFRFLPAVYGDDLGVSERAFRRPTRVRRNNEELPNPRLISSRVHSDSESESIQFAMMVMQWGQYLDHDLTSTPQSRGFNHSMIRCCSDDGQMLPPHLLHPDCRPIVISRDDAFFRRHNVRCMEFIRSSPASRPDCRLGPRNQINQVTSFIDASNVYGSTQEETTQLRLFKHGKLRYTDLHIRKSLLPALNASLSSEECLISSPNLHCFAAGDQRVNEQPGLTSLHTLWVREHNRIARALSKLNRHWDDERIFQESRKIVGAMHQHITFNEWLPVILGPRVIEIFDLSLRPHGFYPNYNESVNPGAANAFAAAAFRFGHSLVRDSLSRCNKRFEEVPMDLKLRREFNNPAHLHNFGSVDRVLLGLTNKALAKRDEFITEELTNHLFQHPHESYGMDLAALNIQRGRDHGIPPYNEWREQCGLRRFRSFDDNMEEAMGQATIDKLNDVYDHVDDVDLFTGGLAEHPVLGGLVGPTFACIIGQQFLNLRQGDRFWYENGPQANPGAFTRSQLQEIRRASLSRVICDNLDDVDKLQPYAFLMIDTFANERKLCRGRAIPRLSLIPWREKNVQPPNQVTLKSLFNKENKKDKKEEMEDKEEMEYREEMATAFRDGMLLLLPDRNAYVGEQGPFTDLFDSSELTTESLHKGMEAEVDGNVLKELPPQFRDASPSVIDLPSRLTRDHYFGFFDADDQSRAVDEQQTNRGAREHLQLESQLEWEQLLHILAQDASL